MLRLLLFIAALSVGVTYVHCQESCQAIVGVVELCTPDVTELFCGSQDHCCRRGLLEPALASAFPNVPAVNQFQCTCLGDTVSQDFNTSCPDSATTTMAPTTAPPSCGDPTDNNCDPNADCEDSSGAIECTCKPGFTGDGITCDDIDECTDDPDACGAGFQCVNTDGSFFCEDIDECTDDLDDCGTGFQCVNTDGSFFCEDIDECLGAPSQCGLGTFCVNLPGTFECQGCSCGFTSIGSTDPTQCVDTDECADGQDDCETGFQCVNTVGSFTCEDIDECADGQDDCETGFQCVNTVGSFTCEDVDECATGEADCGDGICVNTEGGFECVAGCPSDEWTRVCNKCYKYMGDEECYSWRWAERKCNDFNGTLVSIHSCEEDCFVLDLIPAGKTIWIGLNDCDVEGTFTWSDGTIRGYEAWYSGEPNQKNPWSSWQRPNVDCVRMDPAKSYYWADTGCGRVYNFVCQFQLDVSDADAGPCNFEYDSDCTCLE